MANILQSLGNAMERQQQRRHENNMEVLRAIYTRPGMIVLGVILLGAALALIWPQIAPEADNTNSIVIDMSDFRCNFLRPRCGGLLRPRGDAVEKEGAGGNNF